MDRQTVAFAKIDYSEKLSKNYEGKSKGNVFANAFNAPRYGSYLQSTPLSAFTREHSPGGATTHTHVNEYNIMSCTAPLLIESHVSSH